MSSVHASKEGAQEPVDPRVLTLGRANGWLRHASESRRLEGGPPDALGGVTAFADQFTLIEGVTRTKSEIRAKAEKLYGPAYNSHANQ